ncbi:hypothetical protein S245_019862 [Arachis hypogaea]
MTQVFAMPVFDMIETYLVTRLNFSPSSTLRVITRTLFVGIIMLIGISILFFGSLLGFLGGFAFAPTLYFLPFIIWLKLKKPRKYGLSWTINWICIVIGVLIMTLSPIETGFDKEGSGEGSASSASASKQKSLEEWLLITASRNAKWWYSAFHNLTAMVGAGVLSLPYAMTHMGWGLGITVMILSWVITLYMLWQMVEMQEMVPGGKRLDRYHELGQEAFGEKLGLWIVVPQQLLVEVGTCIVYMVTGGKSIKKGSRNLLP